MPEYIANHKGFFFCMLSLLLAFLASFFSKIDLGQIITTITMTYMGGQTVQRGSAYFAAASDPNSSAMSAIQSTISKKYTSQVELSQYAWMFNGLEDSVLGCEKAYDEEET